MKRGHGCEDHGKDIGRLGRDMEPNYGTRYVVYAYVGCQKLWRGDLDVFSALFYMNPQESDRMLMVLKEKSGKR